MTGSGTTWECHLRAAGTQVFDRKRSFYHLQIGRWLVKLRALPTKLRSFSPLLPRFFFFFLFKNIRVIKTKPQCIRVRANSCPRESCTIHKPKEGEHFLLTHTADTYSMLLQCLQYISRITKVIYLKGFKSEQYIIGSLQIDVVHHQLS